MRYVLVSHEQHRGFGFQAEKPFVFASRLDFLPLSFEEIPRLNGVFPLCFKQVGEQLEFGIPCHFVAQNNALVHPLNGKFLLPYVPAVLRRYPFQLLSLPNQTLALAVLESETAFAAGRGQAIVDEAGQLTEKGQHLQRFLVSLHQSFARLQQALVLIKSLNVLRPIQFALPEGSTLQGRTDLYHIDQEAFLRLPAETLKALQTSGAMTLIYANLLNANLMPRLPKVVEAFSKLNQELQKRSDLQKMFDDDDNDSLQF
ncbi:MAG: SapC family protein [Thiotrichales bacterium]|nr:SapC family protein [Thiotrichales bacterium]